MSEQFKDVTRFEVIGSIGRQYVAYDVSVRLELQDDGRTLKVFLEHRDDTDVQAEMHAGLTRWARAVPSWAFWEAKASNERDATGKG